MSNAKTNGTSCTRLSPLLTALMLGVTAGIAAAADPYKPDLGPYAVNTLIADWKDTTRTGGAVSVPVKVYTPRSVHNVKEPLPLIVFSHGLGGSRDGYSMWTEHWASHGYVVVVPTHTGSDTSAVLGATRQPDPAITAVPSVINLQTALGRVRDVNFIITHLEDANAGKLDDPTLAPFKGKIDVKHVGMAGHSFGAATTLMIAGESEGALGRINLGDPRVSAAIAMSPQPASVGNQKTAFGSIKIPVFHMTGTQDDSPPAVGDVKAPDRRIPFDNSPAPGTGLVIFDGAIHMTFSGRMLNPPPSETKIQNLIKQSTTAFWDAHLKDDPKAKTWLNNDFAGVLGTAGKFEQKK
jgi:predicted dienelactone hydrolase